MDHAPPMCLLGLMSPTLIDPHLRVSLGASRAFSLDEAISESQPSSDPSGGTTIDRAPLFFLCLFFGLSAVFTVFPPRPYLF